jgi:hypothetical protein
LHRVRPTQTCHAPSGYDQQPCSCGARLVRRLRHGGSGACLIPQCIRLYQFDDAAALERAVGGDEMKRLIADFNHDWPEATRTRESFTLTETFAADDAGPVLSVPERPVQ